MTVGHMIQPGLKNAARAPKVGSPWTIHYKFLNSSASHQVFNSCNIVVLKNLS